MTDIFKKLDDSLKTPQSKDSIKLYVKFSIYHMYTGYYFNKKQLQHDLHISNSKFRDLLCGDNSVKPSDYSKPLKYMDKQIKSVEK